QRSSRLCSPQPSFISHSTFANPPASNCFGPSPPAASPWTGSPLSTSGSSEFSSPESFSPCSPVSSPKKSAPAARALEAAAPPRKRPQARLGASLPLLALILYLGARFMFHGDAVAALESRTYRGEPPRRVAAFSESNSPFLWYGIVETERALIDVPVPVGPGADFDPGSAITTYKPEPSPALDAARNSAVARRFLQVARFPKATIEQTPSGFHVILRAFPYSRESSGRVTLTDEGRVQALIDTDPSGKILSEELAWIPRSRDFWWK